MLLFELYANESHPTYQKLEIENADRQMDFVESVVKASIAIQRPVFSSEILRALNYHAIACLHIGAGSWRPCDVHCIRADGSRHDYPQFFRVPAMMEMFVDEVNRMWEMTDPVILATFVLWKLNYIHPFINGNGRTARVACLFVICLKLNVWLGGDKLLPQLIVENRDEYVMALMAVDDSIAQGALDLTPLHGLLIRLLDQQSAATTAVPADDFVI